MTIKTDNPPEFIESIQTVLESASSVLTQMKRKYQSTNHQGDLSSQYSDLDATLTLSLMIEHNKIFCKLLTKAKDNASLAKLLYNAYLADEALRSSQSKDLSDYDDIFELLNSLMEDDTLVHLAQNARTWGEIQSAFGTTLRVISALLAVSTYIGFLILISLFVLPYILPILPIIVFILLLPLLIASFACFLNGQFAGGFAFLFLSIVLIEPLIYFAIVLLPLGVSALGAFLISAPVYFLGVSQNYCGEHQIQNSYELERVVHSGNQLQSKDFLSDSNGDVSFDSGIAKRSDPTILRNRFFTASDMKEEFQEELENVLAMS